MSRRLGLDDEASQTIDFLIRHHLKMSRIAFRRDTEEPEVVRQFASMFGTEEQLKMLVLLTLCDVGAVSPDTLTPWKEELLWRLYVDAYNQMTLGYGDDIIDRDQALVAALQANRPADIPEAEMATLPRGAAAAIPDSVFAGRDLSSCQAVARYPAERGALLPREEGRGVGADRRLARQAVSVLEHLRRAGVLRHGHSARARADEPGGAGARRISVCRRRRVLRAQLARAERVRSPPARSGRRRDRRDVAAEEQGRQRARSRARSCGARQSCISIRATRSATPCSSSWPTTRRACCTGSAG